MWWTPDLGLSHSPLAQCWQILSQRLNQAQHWLPYTGLDSLTAVDSHVPGALFTLLSVCDFSTSGC